MGQCRACGKDGLSFPAYKKHLADNEKCAKIVEKLREKEGKTGTGMKGLKDLGEKFGSGFGK